MSETSVQDTDAKKEKKKSEGLNTLKTSLTISYTNKVFSNKILFVYIDGMKVME